MTEPHATMSPYREVLPPAALRGVVACFWIREARTDGVVHVVPDGCTDVVWQQGDGTTIAGPDTTAKVVRRARGDVLVGVRFVPGAGGGVLGVPLDELRDLRVEAAEIDRAFDVDAELAPAEVLVRFAFAAARRGADPLVADAARKIERQEVSAVARELSVSERHLRRRFHAAVGYGPSTLARVLRFRRFVDRVDGGQTDLAALAFEAGYADQPHLTRETRRLAGLTPVAFIRSRGIAAGVPPPH
jgi:AraC-like DNA-binding protein